MWHADSGAVANRPGTNFLRGAQRTDRTVYARAPYKSRGGPDMLNDADTIHRNGGSRSLLAVRRRGSGYVGSIAVGVHR